MSIFQDWRLDKRLAKLKAGIRASGKVKLTENLLEWSELKAAYRFLK